MSGDRLSLGQAPPTLPGQITTKSISLIKMTEQGKEEKPAPEGVYEVHSHLFVSPVQKKKGRCFPASGAREKSADCQRRLDSASPFFG